MRTASAQTIKDYPTAPHVKTLSVGALECTVWSQSPAPGFVQIACCDTACAGNYRGALILNQILDVRISGNFGTAIAPGIGAVAWALWPHGGGTVNYQITVNNQQGTFGGSGLLAPYNPVAAGTPPLHAYEAGVF